MRLLYIGILFMSFIVVFAAGCTVDNTGNATDDIDDDAIIRDNVPDNDSAYGIDAQDVNYFEDTTGYLARPSEPGSYPAVIVIHEWWGLNDNIRNMTRQLAEEGYVALAVDLYDGQVATNADEARALVSSVNEGRAIENMQAARQYLMDNNDISAVGSLGWCFGGGQSLQLAMNDESIDAVVIYYGNLVTNESDLSALESRPVLGIFAQNDTSIPVSQVQEFNNTLNELGTPHEIYIYPDVGHAFANPSNSGHDPQKTADAWNKTLAFLDENLKE